jgi:hypothetical protein
MEQQVKSVEEMSTQELEAYLEKKKKKEQKARENERQNYELGRDSVVENMVARAREISEILKSFKTELNIVFEEHSEKLQKYGAIRSNSKGGFKLEHSNKEMKAVRTRSTKPDWDERSGKALTLLADFMQDTIKKKDVKLYEILKTFIQRNDKGELEYSKVMSLLAHRDKYSDPRWVEGLKLIEESYSITLRGYGFDFFEKDSLGKWERVELNFPAILIPFLNKQP